MVQFSVSYFEYCGMTTHNGESFIHKLHDVMNDPRISENQKAKNENILNLKKSADDIKNLDTINNKLDDEEKYNYLLQEVQKYHSHNPSQYFPSELVENLAKYYKKEKVKLDVRTQTVIDEVESLDTAKSKSKPKGR